MTKSTFKRPPLRQRRRHLFRQLFNGWPWLVWLAAAILAVVLLPGGMYRVRFFGKAEKIYEYVSPLENGRLKTLNVELGDQVDAGELIGELDNESLATELLMDQASLMKTRDKVHSIRYELESMKLEQAKTDAQLRALEAQQKRNQNLLEQRLVLEQNMEDLTPQIEATQVVLDRYPTVIHQLEARLKDAEKDTDRFNSSDLADLMAAQSRLTTTMPGVVAEVLHQPGDIVETGDPVVRVSNVSTRRVIAFMPEAKRMDLAIGERCRIITQTNRDRHLGVVKSITADIRKLPVNTGFSDQMLMGRRIVIELDNGELIPGEQVVVVPDISIFEQWFGKK
ncbi:MAG: HlyD family efflux transporter periplasmic adaptor subunit [Pontiellaceae bacterium]|nr:HlyD family efflux transporter periplasmic adaptor subunit [Pontiellaceae bacterium]MBN2784896.1 HlyD family efflux transporter periplasmic adaptor subunit [Pontiellaceae bacterium]